MTHFDSCTLAVDAGGTSLKAALVVGGPGSGEKPALLKETFFSVAIDSRGSSRAILDTYQILGEKGAAAARERGRSITRIAVCTPGPFDYAGGFSLMKHKYQSVYGISLRPSLLAGVGSDCPVTFVHDSTAFLLGARLSEAVKEDCFCGVIIGTGLGFSSMVSGKVQENSQGGPAISIYARPYLDGTAEDYVSKRGILRRYAQESGTRPDLLPSVAGIAHMAREGDPHARKAFADMGFHLARILSPVLEEYSFSTIVFGGAISKSADLFLPCFSQYLPHIHAVRLTAGSIDYAPLLGAMGCQELR